MPSLSAAPSRRPASKPLEYPSPLVDGDARTRILHGQAHPRSPELHADPGHTVAVPSGVVDEVGHDPLETALVGLHDGAARRSLDLHGHDPGSAGAQRVEHELGQHHLFEGQLGHAGVDPRDLEEVLDELAEPPHLLRQQVEALPCSFRHLVPPSGDHLQRGGEGRQRRPELMADVGGETGVSLDPRLEGVGHAVERDGHARQVRVPRSSRRTSSRPAATAAAAAETSATGASTRRLAHRPTAAPARAVATAATAIELRSTARVRSRSDKANTSK